MLCILIFLLILIFFFKVLKNNSRIQKFTNCNSIMKIPLYLHVLTKFNFTINNQILYNYLDELELNKIVSQINKYWIKYCIKFNVINIDFEDVEENLAKIYPNNFDRLNEARSIAKTIKSGEKSIQYRNELYSLIDFDLTDDRYFQIYFIPYLGKDLICRSINGNGLSIFIALWTYENNKIIKSFDSDNLCNSVNHLNRHLGYCFGLKSESGNNLMNIKCISDYLTKSQINIIKKTAITTSPNLSSLKKIKNNEVLNYDFLDSVDKYKKIKCNFLTKNDNYKCNYYIDSNQKPIYYNRDIYKELQDAKKLRNLDKNDFYFTNCRKNKYEIRKKPFY